MALDGSGGTNTLSLTGTGAFKLATPKALTNIQVIDVTEGQAAFGPLAATNQTVTLKSFQNFTVNVSGGGMCGLNAFDSGINTVFLKASTVAWNFTANAEAGLTIRDQSATLDTITAGGAGQTITGGAAGKLIMIAAAQGGTIFRDTANQFNGDTIENFATTADAGNVIDITDINFSKLTTATFTENPAGTQGQLKLSDGTHTATVTLFGQFVAGMNTAAAAAGFIIASDGGTGVRVTHPLAVPH